MPYTNILFCRATITLIFNRFGTCCCSERHRQKQTHGRERARVRDMIKISNGIGTRAIHPVEIDLPTARNTFRKIEQTVGIHLTIPQPNKII